jgi:serine/threonine protein phosphatase PrpC
MGAQEVGLQIRPGIELASLTDLGCQRSNNEDRYSYWEPASDEEFARKGRLAIVADGMGGYEGGQEASRIAVETVGQVYAGAADGAPQSSLIDALRKAHQSIHDYAAVHFELHGMGTTCTAIAVVGKSLYYAHIGDSRLYLVRGPNISRLTHDHSYVGRLVESGVISLEEAEIHPQRHILTAALGSGVEISPDYPEAPVALEKGDVLILCTDGLWSLVNESELQNAIRGDLQESCRGLIGIARERGGPDNITVQLLRVE